MKDEILNIVLQQLKEIGEEQEIDELINCKANTPVYARNGTIDSITLVYLVTELEEAVELKFDEIITLVDEKAMSQKISPFRSANSLADYMLKLIESDE
jgi:acyl carrier protein